MVAVLEHIVPAIKWLRSYKLSDLKADFPAGLIVAIMIVPQAMAYAMLAGLPPVIGLYASTLPIVVYALFGSSRQLAVGPVAMISLLVFAECSKIAKPGTDEYVSVILLLTLMVGGTQLLLGLFRMGFLTNFISHAVIGGFTSAAAIIIGLSQLKHLLGVKLGSQDSAVRLLLEVIHNLPEVNLPTLAIGAACILFLMLVRKLAPRFPAPLFAVVVGTVCMFLLQLNRAGVEIVGNVPRGLPKFSIPQMNARHLQSLFSTSLVIVFVGFMESISIAQYVADKEKYKINPNQELRALGLANVVGALFSGYPVTGGFSRTAVNHQAGALTPAASILTAIVVTFTLLLLTPLFYYLPKSILAGIIIVAVAGLVNVKDALRLFKIKKADGWTLLATFLITLSIGIEKGILVGITVSLLLFVWRSAHPRTAELGYLKDNHVFRDVKVFQEAETYPRTLIMRVDSALYFANMGFVEDRLRKHIAEKPDTKHVIMDLSGVNDIDAVAINKLEEIMSNYRDRGIRFLLAGMKRQVRDVLDRADWYDKHSEDIKYLSLEHALKELGQWR